MNLRRARPTDRVLTAVIAHTGDMTAALKALLTAEAPSPKNKTGPPPRHYPPAPGTGSRPPQAGGPPTASPPSQRDSNPPAELVTLIACDVPRRYPASTSCGPAPPPGEPSGHANPSDSAE